MNPQQAASIFNAFVTFPDKCPECGSENVESNTDRPTDPELTMLCTDCEHTWEPNADGLTPEEYDAHEREQDRLQREHDRAMDERCA